MTTHTITITPGDIAKGKRGCVSGCPVARALHRALGNRFETVNGQNVRIDGNTPECGGSRGRRLALPAKVVDWITAFDSRRTMQPITFTLDVPDPEAVAS